MWTFQSLKRANGSKSHVKSGWVFFLPFSSSDHFIYSPQWVLCPLSALIFCAVRAAVTDTFTGCSLMCDNTCGQQCEQHIHHSRAGIENHQHCTTAFHLPQCCICAADHPQNIRFTVLFYYSEACYTLFTAFLLFLFKTLYPFLFIPSVTISLFSRELPELLRAAWCWADRVALKDQTSVFPSFYSSSRLLSHFPARAACRIVSSPSLPSAAILDQYGIEIN